MKKHSIFFVFILFSISVYAQDIVDNEITLEYINRCYNYLNKPVPVNFVNVGSSDGPIRRGERFVNQLGDIFLHAHNNNVFFSSFGLLFELTSAANRFHTMIIDTLETTGWRYYGKTPFNNMDIYIKNNVGALVGPVRRRSSDNLLIVSVDFLTEEDFPDMFEYP